MRNSPKRLIEYILAIGMAIVISCFIALWICDIDPVKTYSWTGGIWHGIFFIPNLILSISSETIYKANYYTMGYNVFWWIFTIISPILSLSIGSLVGNVLIKGLYFLLLLVGGMIAKLFSMIAKLFSKKDE